MPAPPAAGPLSPPSMSIAASSHPWKPAVAERQWTSIVLHHTATDHGSVEAIHESHLQKKWLGIGYHFVIGNGSGMEDGAIEPTFRWREQLHGAHAGDDEYNQHGIGIALVGNFETDRPSAAQLAAIKRLVGALRAAYGIPTDRVLGHSDVKTTACPGRYFPLTDVSRSFAPEFLSHGLRPGAADAAGWSPRPAARLASQAAPLVHVSLRSPTESQHP
jgi:N-acetyl-anhydromuramyl-L-alanine amidase AmpD